MKKDKTFGFIGHAAVGTTTLHGLRLPRVECPAVILVEEDFKAARNIAITEAKRLPGGNIAHAPVADNLTSQNQLQEILKLPKLDLTLSATRLMNRAEKRAQERKHKKHRK